MSHAPRPLESSRLGFVFTIGRIPARKPTVKAGDGGRHLMTFHPFGGGHSSTVFHYSDCLDFNMVQSGHNPTSANYSRLQIDYNLRPPKPCMDGEPAYEYPPDAIPTNRPVGALLLLAASALGATTSDATVPQWKKQVLTDKYFCDGITAGDVNHDGQPDIAAGPFWYEGPGINDQGWSDGRIARALELNRHTCRLWRQRFLREGVESLWEVGEGRSRKPRAGLSQQIVEATLHTKPEGQTHWSTRTLARRQGVHASTVCRIWQEHELQLHRQETFKRSRDPAFVAKLLDVVGVYLTPPQNALVLCVDEKSQIQALDRTQPGLPLKPGRCGTWTHDYVRHGTTTLFAALEVAQGKVVGQCFFRHRHQEFLKFLKQLDVEYPGEAELHLVMDNYGTHKHARVVHWLERHPRFKMHFIPRSSSWLNLVERWFAELTGKAVRRGSFSSVPDLIEAIFTFMDHWNRVGKAFVWTAKAETILRKLERCRNRLEAIQPGCTTRKPRARPIVWLFAQRPTSTSAAYSRSGRRSTPIWSAGPTSTASRS